MKIIRDTINLMSMEIPGGRGVFDPLYWEGCDIRGDDTKNLHERRQWKLAFKDINKPRKAAGEAIKQVITGNHSEIRFGSGNEFDPIKGGIPTGSLVVIDYEQLATKQLYGYEPSLSSPISEPFIDYWREYNHLPYAGTDYIEGDDLHYHRMVTWGVVAETDFFDYRAQPPIRGQKRVGIQPMSFGSITYDGNKLKVPKFPDIGIWYNLIFTPVTIGEVELTSYEWNDNNKSAESIGRIRSIDLIYLAKSEKKGRRVREMGAKLGQITVPTTGVY